MGSSILTNTGAMTALQSLRSTQQQLAVTQQQISTGLKLNDASQGAALWTLATKMRSDVSALGAVDDAFNTSSSILTTANTAVTSVLTLLNRMKADVVAAQGGTSTVAASQTDIANVQQELIAVVGGSSFNSVNLLDGSAGSSAGIAGFFSRNAAGDISVQNVNVTTAGTGGTQVAGTGGMLAVSIGTFSGSGVGGTAGTSTNAPGNYAAGSLLAVNITNATTADLDKISAGIDAAIAQVTNGSTQLQNAATSVTDMQTYEQSLSASLTSGIGNLVDADLNLASTRLQALQTQQALGIQALSIANQNNTLILKLFGAD